MKGHETLVAGPSGTTATGSAGDRRGLDAIPNYELIAHIGSGGFGDVYLARECVTDATRAVKIVPKCDVARAARDIEGIKRYQRCAHQHANLVQILTVGETEQAFYYVMEVADNSTATASDEYRPMTLHGAMRSRGRFSAAEALGLVRQLASAVVRLNEEGLAHNDLKPDNVLFVRGDPKIADLGLVGPNNATRGAGTPAYMTPEGGADDTYALGKLLYQLISGKPASDYPRLPPDLATRPSRELSAAVAIANRACHPDAARRFDSAGSMLVELEAAAGSGGKPQARRTRAMAAAILIVSMGCAVAGLRYRESRAGSAADKPVNQLAAPRLVYEQDLVIKPEDLKFVRAAPRDAGVMSPVYANLLIGGRPIPGVGAYAFELPRQLENFVVDYRVRSLRPWISVNLGVARSPDDQEAACVGFAGQPDGEGLQMVLAPGSGAESAPIIGLPLPGVEYVVRLAHCRDELELAVWPLGQYALNPIIRTARFARDAFAPRFLLFDSGTADRHAQTEVLSVRVAAYTRPLDRAADARPKEVDGRVVPALVPPIKNVSTPFNTNLLVGGLNPYESDDWMAIGHWAWWSGNAPVNLPKAIKSIPCSTAKRAKIRGVLDESGSPFGEEAFDGRQCLRFDGAEYGDFRATVRVVFADQADGGPERDDPLLCKSHDACVGLNLRMQSAAPPGCVWGGGYGATLAIPSSSVVDLRASIDAFVGLELQSKPHFKIEWVPRKDPLSAVAANVGPRSALFAKDGFTLTVEAVGPDIRFFVNNESVPAVELHDPAPDYFKRGRLGLYTSRLMATFQELVVTPIESPRP